MKVKILIAVIAVFAAMLLSGCAAKDNAAGAPAAPDRPSAPAAGSVKAPGKTAAKPAKDIPFVTLSCREGEDITQALRDILKEKRRVLIPRGTYRISGTVSLPSDTVIKGEAGTVLMVDSIKREGVVMLGMSTPETPEGRIFEAAGEVIEKGKPAKRCENVTISDLTFIAGKPLDYVAVSGLSVRGLTIQNVKTEGMRLAFVSVASRLWNGMISVIQDGKSMTTDEYLCRDVRITGCSADCKARELDSSPCIHIDSCLDFAIESCRIENCGTGIELKGGESRTIEYQKDDFVRVKNGSVAGCTVNKAQKDGIVSVRCDRITVKECSAAECKWGSGISFEGSGEFKAEGCTVSDCGGINYYTAFSCSGTTVFRKCRSLFSDVRKGYDAQHFLCQNSFQVPSEARVLVENCELESTVESRVYISGPVKDYTFISNRCVNTTFEMEANNNEAGHEKNIGIEKNIFRYKGVGQAYQGIKVRAAERLTLNVCDNTIAGDQGIEPIVITDLSQAGGCKARIDGNTISGFREGIFIGAKTDITVTGRDFKGEIKTL